MKINYPSEASRAVIPGINTLLFIGCCGVVVHFQTSGAMALPMVLP
jgi:KUP system potassium uptake protein